MSDEDQVAQIFEHPFDHYTSFESDNRPAERHNHADNIDRQKCARRQVMETEYSRTICKSAERYRLRSGSRGHTKADLSEQMEAYLPNKKMMVSAALSIPSFQ